MMINMIIKLIEINFLLSAPYYGPPKNYHILIPGIIIAIYFFLQELFMYKKTKLNFHRYYSIFFVLLLCSWCLILMSIFLNLRPRTFITFLYGIFMLLPFFISLYFFFRAVRLQKLYKKTMKEKS